MAKNALLLHGTNGSPEENWLPWIKNRLEWRGFDVSIPQLPKPFEPNMNRYWEMLKSYPYDSHTIIVGHSSGGVAALGILDRLPETVTVSKVILIGAFVRDEGWHCEGMFQPPLDYPRLRHRARHIEIWWSPGDQYIAKSQTDELAHALGVRPQVFPDEYGHFNLETNHRFLQLPELVDAMVS